MTIENKKAASILRRHLSVLNIGTGALALAVASSWAVPAIAQQTTSSMTGQIVTAAGAPATGAEVTIVHTPSGTRSVTSVNDQGRFQAGGLRVGGPYTVTITAPGAEPQVLEGIFISLGEPFALDLALGSQMEEIVVSGQRIASRTVGIGTNFGEGQISAAPSISRDLKDIVRNDPKVFIDAGNSNAIQIAGANNRFNSLTIDGVKQNDDFGLNNGGYPTQRSPLSLETVEGLSVLTAPYDVEYSGFQGGTINVVTKSGGNDPHGSFYYYYGDESLSGDRSGSRRNLISPYKETTWGGSLSGALVEDKLFFYTNYEKFKSQAPVVFGTQDSGLGNPITGVTTAQVNQVREIAQRVYGYDTLGLADGSLPEADEKILTKLDWNITDDHRASFAYQRNKGNNIIDASSSTSANPRTLSLQSNFYDRTQIMDSYSFQLFSDWTSDFSTEVKLARKEVESLRLPLNGLGFGEMRVTTPGGAQVVIGPDISSHSNYLTTTTDSAKFKGTYLLGDHKITGGYEYDKYDYFNLFLQRSLGYWEFSSIANFEARNASRFRYANAPSGNADDAAADWQYTQHSFYLQDTWDVTPDLQLQGGLRYELYDNNKAPKANANFLSRYGISNTETIDGKDIWLPRLGITYKPFEDTTVRGGAGLFTGMGPVVWLSNNYSNDGITQRSLDVSRPTTGTVSAADALLLNGVNGQVPAAATARLASIGEGFVNALDPNYELPSSWKYSIAIDQSVDIPYLGDDWLFTAEAIYTEVKNANFYKDLRLVQVGTAPDGRPIYGQRAQTTVNAAGATVTRAAGSDLLLTNTKKGDGLVLSLYVSKNWETDYGTFDLAGGYAYQNVKDASQGTSSVAGSNYEQFVTTDPNVDLLDTSSYELKHRFNASTTYSVEYFDGYKTSLSLFGEARSGKPYSFVFGCSNTQNPFGDPACRSTRSRQALYVPSGASDPLIDWAASSITPAQMDSYIERNGLSKYRGSVIPRGALESSWIYSLDAKLAQEIPAPIEGHKAILTMDITNLTNLLNSSWGRNQEIPFFNAVNAINANIVNNKYVFTGALREPSETVRNRASVWKIQLGVKYEF